MSVPHPDDQMPTRGCPSCRAAGVADARRRVFCASLGDWLDNEVPAEWLADLLDLIRRTPNLDWLLLTKRIGNWRSRLQSARASVAGAGESIALRDFIENWLNDIPPPNVWIGATVCNQAEADRDVSKLLRVPAAVRFLSIEPMLGPIDLRPFFAANDLRRIDGGPALDWIIVGGESGTEARPMHPEWARSLRDQCALSGVPFLFKQWGEWLPTESADQPVYRGEHRHLGDSWHAFKIGKKAAGRVLDGVTHNGYPTP